MDALRIVARESPPLMALQLYQVARGISLPRGWHYQCRVGYTTLVPLPRQLLGEPELKLRWALCPRPVQAPRLAWIDRDLFLDWSNVHQTDIPTKSLLTLYVTL